MSGISWLCRVPFSIKQAKQLTSTIASKDLIKSRIPGYSWWEVPSRYGGVEQRWLLVESQERKAADLERLENKIQQELTEAKKKLHQLKGIHLVIIDGVKQVINLTDERWWTLSFFPQQCHKYYLLSG